MECAWGMAGPGKEQGVPETDLGQATMFSAGGGFCAFTQPAGAREEGQTGQGRVVVAGICHAFESFRSS